MADIFFGFLFMPATFFSLLLLFKSNLKRGILLRAQWTAGKRFWRMRGRALSSRYIISSHVFSTHYFSAGQLYKRAPVNWMRARVGRVRRVHRSAEGLRLTSKSATTNHKRPQDNNRSCDITIMWCQDRVISHQDHVKPPSCNTSQDQWLLPLFLIRTYLYF